HGRSSRHFSARRSGRSVLASFANHSARGAFMTRIRARRLGGLTSSAIRDLLEVTARPEVISLAGGLPAVELLPTARLAEAAVSALADPATAQYTETCGLGDLRTVIAARESARLGRTVDP